MSFCQRATEGTFSYRALLRHRWHLLQAPGLDAQHIKQKNRIYISLYIVLKINFVARYIKIVLFYQDYFYVRTWNINMALRRKYSFYSQFHDKFCILFLFQSHILLPCLYDNISYLLISFLFWDNFPKKCWYSSNMLQKRLSQINGRCVFDTKNQDIIMRNKHLINIHVMQFGWNTSQMVMTVAVVLNARHMSINTLISDWNCRFAWLCANKAARNFES